MDIERSIQFLVDSQAKYEARADARLDKLDKRIGGITKLVQQGMRMLVAQQKHTAKLDRALVQLAESHKATDRKLAELAESHKATDRKLAELAESQKATDRTLRAFIDSMRKGRNGH